MENKSNMQTDEKVNRVSQMSKIQEEGLNLFKKKNQD